MKSNQLKKTLMAIGLGLGISLSGTSSAIDMEAACQYFAEKCAAGDRFACIRLANHC